MTVICTPPRRISPIEVRRSALALSKAPDAGRSPVSVPCATLRFAGLEVHMRMRMAPDDHRATAAKPEV